MKYNTNNERDIRDFAESILCPLPSAFVTLLSYHDRVEEITTYGEGDIVQYTPEDTEAEIVLDYGDGTYDIELDDGTLYEEVPGCDLEKLTAENGLEPAHGTVWYFRDDSNSEWAYAHAKEISDCGFRVYNSPYTPNGYGDDARGLGVILGLDGSGYNFFDPDNGHFKRLLKAFRGGIFATE